MHHVRELATWQKGGHIFPIQVEISPTNICNHHCVFCAYDYIDRKDKHYLNFDILSDTICQLHNLGTKSLFYSGEGEPLIYKQLPDIIEYASNLNFSQAINTNGVLLTEEKIKRIIPHLDWIRISINGADKETYANVHRCKESDYLSVLKNIKHMCKVRDENHLKIVIGIQMVDVNQSIKYIDDFIIKIREYGVSYFAIKRFNQHPDIAKKDVVDKINIFNNLKKYSTDKFDVVIRDNINNKSINENKRKYKQCFGMKFFAEITSDGNVYSCGPHLGNKLFSYGNINNKQFREIWSKENIDVKFNEIMDTINIDKDCMPNCRLHNVNNFLWQLYNKPQHINFI